MIKKILAALTVVGVVTLGLATPADARGRSHHRILTGDMELVLNAGLGLDPADPHVDVSWVGTWEIGRHRSYDIVFFLRVPATLIGDTGWAYGVEDVALYDAGTVTLDADGYVVPFERDDYVMYGNDAALLFLAAMSATATGFVVDVNPALDDFHRFGDNDVGNVIGYTGTLTGPTSFAGTFTVQGVGSR